jgi:hypothetical protein
MHYRTYDDAVERATRFAMRASVDVWYTIDGSNFLRVAQFRSAADQASQPRPENTD